MRVSIRLSNDNSQLTYQVTIPDNSTVNDLKAAAAVAAPHNLSIQSLSLSSFSLIFNAQKLELSYPVKSYNIENDSVVYLINQQYSYNDMVLVDADAESIGNTTTSKGGDASVANADGSTGIEEKQEKKRRRSSNKKKCTFTSCSNQPLKIVGDCIHCDGHFCSKHRMLESHNCSGLQNCKDQSHERNGMKLLNEQTVSSKV